MCWIRAGGGHVRVGRTVWNTLKGAGTEKSGGETKILEGEGASWVKGWVPYKGGGDGTPLQTMSIPV